jgi:hypothetical protein
VEQLRDQAQTIDPSDQESVETFRRNVQSECEQTLAALDGLEEEIKDLKSQGDKIRKRELSLEMLEEKYQKHFESYQKGSAKS